MKPIDKLRMDELLKIKAIVLNEEREQVIKDVDKPVRRTSS